jgi:prophage maintenance system killer protein
MALASPRTSFGGVERYPTLPSKAGVLVYTLSKSQACPDGNKRIALILLRAFLYINDATLLAPNYEIAEMILTAAESDRSDRDEMIDRLTDWLQRRITGEESSA